MQRLGGLNSQFSSAKEKLLDTVTFDGVTYKQVIDHHPSREIKFHYFKWQGWGYRDSGFDLSKDECVVVEGNRYMFGGMRLPAFSKWIVDNVGISFKERVRE